MRTIVLAALAAMTFGLVQASPASANGAWTCMSPAFACGDAPVARTHRSYAGEPKARRRVASKHKSVRHAKARPVQHAKVELPQPKPAQPQQAAKAVAPAEKPQQQAALAPADKSPVLEKKPEIAVRTVETEPPYRVTSTQQGMASYYWQGQMTASGRRFNPNALTAAHRSLPFGTRVRVTNKRNGKTVVVTINDRGPFVRGRIIDLSSAAAGVIGMKGAGVVPVKVERIGG